MNCELLEENGWRFVNGLGWKSDTVSKYDKLDSDHDKAIKEAFHEYDCDMYFKEDELP